MTERRPKITLQPDVLRWARERTGFDPAELAGKLQVKPERVLEWERSGEISVPQIRKLAQRTYTPEGYLFLDAPPDDSLPIADFRTIGYRPLARPSPNLLDTIYQMQRRQDWMREELLIEEADPLEFVGAFSLNSPPSQVAHAMRDVLQVTNGWASAEFSWSQSLSRLRDWIENVGVLVVFNGVVGNNTSRKLDREEFQGFALADQYAPLIFVNNADFKAAQIFTLAHELAHLFVAQSGVSHIPNLQPTEHPTERFCDIAAAEFLVPGDELNGFWLTVSQSDNPFQAIARHFKVSSLVAARRTLDLGLIERDDFFDFYERHKQRNEGLSDSQGGDFWVNQRWRIGPRFAAAVARAVKEGRLLYREAYSLTGLTPKSFENMSARMGIAL